MIKPVTKDPKGISVWGFSTQPPSQDGHDPFAIHVNVANEFSVITEKDEFGPNDFFVIEDSAGQLWEKKKLRFSKINIETIGDGTVYKKFLQVERDKLANIEPFADITDVENVTLAIEQIPVNAHIDIVSPGADIDDAALKRHTRGADTTLGVMTASIDMGDHYIHNVQTPFSDSDAVNKAYVHSITGNVIHTDQPGEIVLIHSAENITGQEVLVIEQQSGVPPEWFKRKIYVSDLRETIDDAYHYNVPHEFYRSHPKINLVDGDVFLIEDIGDGFAKKQAIVGNFFIPHIDPVAIHSDVEDEFHFIYNKGTPEGADKVLIEDSSSDPLWGKKYITLSQLASNNNDPFAFHYNILDEFANHLDTEGTVENDDWVMIEKWSGASHDPGKKYKISFSQLPSAYDAFAFHKNRYAEMDDLPDRSGAQALDDHVLLEIAGATDQDRTKAKILVRNLPTGSGGQNNYGYNMTTGLGVSIFRGMDTQFPARFNFNTLGSLVPGMQFDVIPPGHIIHRIQNIELFRDALEDYDHQFMTSTERGIWDTAAAATGVNSAWIAYWNAPIVGGKALMWAQIRLEREAAIANVNRSISGVSERVSDNKKDIDKLRVDLDALDVDAITGLAPYPWFVDPPPEYLLATQEVAQHKILYQKPIVSRSKEADVGDDSMYKNLEIVTLTDLNDQKALLIRLKDVFNKAETTGLERANYSAYKPYNRKSWEQQNRDCVLGLYPLTVCNKSDVFGLEFRVPLEIKKTVSLYDSYELFADWYLSNPPENVGEDSPYAGEITNILKPVVNNPDDDNDTETLWFYGLGQSLDPDLANRILIGYEGNEETGQKRISLVPIAYDIENTGGEDGPLYWSLVWWKNHDVDTFSTLWKIRKITTADQSSIYTKFSALAIRTTSNNSLKIQYKAQAVTPDDPAYTNDYFQASLSAGMVDNKRMFLPHIARTNVQLPEGYFFIPTTSIKPVEYLIPDTNIHWPLNTAVSGGLVSQVLHNDNYFIRIPILVPIEGGQPVAQIRCLQTPKSFSGKDKVTPLFNIKEPVTPDTLIFKGLGVIIKKLLLDNSKTSMSVPPISTLYGLVNQEQQEDYIGDFKFRNIQINNPYTNEDILSIYEDTYDPTMVGDTIVVKADPLQIKRLGTQVQTLNMGGHQIDNLATPLQAENTKAVNVELLKDYVAQEIADLKAKAHFKDHDEGTDPLDEDLDLGGDETSWRPEAIPGVVVPHKIVNQADGDVNTPTDGVNINTLVTYVNQHGSGADPFAIHFNASDEINANVPTKANPVVGDWVVIEDSEDGWSKKKTPYNAGTYDPAAIHLNINDEIHAALSPKTTPIGSDLVVIEDSEDNWAKKKAPYPIGVVSHYSTFTLTASENYLTNDDYEKQFFCDPASNAIAVYLPSIISETAGKSIAFANISLSFTYEVLLYPDGTDSILSAYPCTIKPFNSLVIINDGTSKWSIIGGNGITGIPLFSPNYLNIYNTFYPTSLRIGIQDNSSAHYDIICEARATDCIYTIPDNNNNLSNFVVTGNENKIILNSTGTSNLNVPLTGNLVGTGNLHKITLTGSADSSLGVPVSGTLITEDYGPIQDTLHSNIANEIHGNMPAKTLPNDTDVIVLEDSEDTWNKKHATIASLGINKKYVSTYVMAKGANNRYAPYNNTYRHWDIHSLPHIVYSFTDIALLPPSSVVLPNGRIVLLSSNYTNPSGSLGRIRYSDINNDQVWHSIDFGSFLGTDTIWTRLEAEAGGSMVATAGWDGRAEPWSGPTFKIYFAINNDPTNYSATNVPKFYHIEEDIKDLCYFYSNYWFMCSYGGGTRAIYRFQSDPLNFTSVYYDNSASGTFECIMPISKRWLVGLGKPYNVISVDYGANWNYLGSNDISFKKAVTAEPDRVNTTATIVAIHKWTAKIYRSIDSGATFTEVFSLENKNPSDPLPIYIMNDIIYMGYNWLMAVGVKVEEATPYVARSMAWESYDNGETWQEVEWDTNNVTFDSVFYHHLNGTLYFTTYNQTNGVHNLYKRQYGNLL